MVQWRLTSGVCRTIGEPSRGSLFEQQILQAFFHTSRLAKDEGLRTGLFGPIRPEGTASLSRRGERLGAFSSFLKGREPPTRLARPSGPAVAFAPPSFGEGRSALNPVFSVRQSRQDFRFSRFGGKINRLT